MQLDIHVHCIHSYDLNMAVYTCIKVGKLSDLIVFFFYLNFKNPGAFNDVAPNSVVPFTQSAAPPTRSPSLMHACIEHAL